MEQNLKELLLKDLCARVPYHPKGRVVNACNGSMCDEWLTCATFTMFTNIMNNCRLYLRPMSSMTEEEEIEISKILNYEFYLNCDGGLTAEDDRHSISMMIMDNYINFLLSHHFDFRRIWDRYEEKSMIELGLALPAPDGMYNLEKK